jgi:hypothetical protein
MAWTFLGTNTLVWQPDTRVSTFPSGLVLVQRSAICRNTYLTTARGSITLGVALPCDSPSTVTVFQFPQAQEIHEGDGFVRFDVSGYGYYGSGFTRQEEFIFYDRSSFGPFTFTNQLIVPRIFRTLVVDSTITVNPFDYTPSGGIVVRNRTGGTISVLSATWALESSDVSGYFGAYKEINVVFSPGFTVE